LKKWLFCAAGIFDARVQMVMSTLPFAQTRSMLQNRTYTFEIHQNDRSQTLSAFARCA
jgi:hypothetical protein